MKLAILLVLILVSNVVFASTKKQIGRHSMLTVVYKKNRMPHEFSVFKDEKNQNEYLLYHIGNKGKAKFKKISLHQYYWIKEQASGILWDNNYREPASKKSCTVFAKINISGIKATICGENPEMVGRSYGFVNSLGSLLE